MDELHEQPVARLDRVIVDVACRRFSMVQPRWLHFGDSLIVLRRMYSGRVRSFALQSLLLNWLPSPSSDTSSGSSSSSGNGPAHRALNDARSIQKLAHQALPAEYNTGYSLDPDTTTPLDLFYSLLAGSAQPTIPSRAHGAL